jgi:hypothetical protein
MSSRMSFNTTVPSSYSEGASVSFRARNLTVDSFKLNLLGQVSADDSRKSIVCLEIATGVYPAPKWLLNNCEGCEVPNELTKVKVDIRVSHN